MQIAIRKCPAERWTDSVSLVPSALLVVASALLVVTSATLVVTSALLVVTMFATSNKCHATRNSCKSALARFRLELGVPVRRSTGRLGWELSFKPNAIYQT